MRVWIADMSQNDSGAYKYDGSYDRIEGPIRELNKFDEFTGYDYYRCRNCGAEAMRRLDLEGCCSA